jgi:hypothetical protein
MTAGREISRTDTAPGLAGGAAAAAPRFKTVMWLGIAANVVVALTSIVWTEAVLNFLGLEMAQPLVWPRFACVLLILLSIFYVQSAVDPLVHRYSAVVAVICRFAGVAFFTIVGGDTSSSACSI